MIDECNLDLIEFRKKYIYQFLEEKEIRMSDIRFIYDGNGFFFFYQ